MLFSKNEITRYICKTVTIALNKKNPQWISYLGIFTLEFGKTNIIFNDRVLNCKISSQKKNLKDGLSGQMILQFINASDLLSY